MARNGAGVYSNPYPNFVNGTVISSDQADANNAAIGTALTQSIAVDGQTTITANLPMNSKKFTGLAVGTAATDSLTLGQAQAPAFAWGGTAGGGADAITIAPTPAITAYAVGQKFFWIASGSANTGAATIAISGLTAIAMQDGGAALAAGVHAAGKVFMGVLNTTSTVQIMQVQSSGDPLTISALTVNGTSQFSGAIIQGVNGTGYDATFFGDTPGAYLMWDQSADKLLTAGGALVDIVKDKLMIGGTAVTTTAAELNFNDTATAGTVVASKTVVASADKDIASFRNITLTGELDAGSLDISGIADIAGTTTVVALTASGVVTANANIDLNGTELILDADADTSITADTDDTIDIRIAGADDFQFTANDFTALSGSVISTNTIAETTGGSGVTVDGLLIKDGGLSDLVLPAVSGIVEVNSAFIDMCLVGPSVDGMSWNGHFSKASVWTSLMLATVETSGSDAQVNIWDLAGGTLAGATPLATLTLSGATPTSIAASMGYVMVGTSDQGVHVVAPFDTGAWAEKTQGWPRSLTTSGAPVLVNVNISHVAAGMSAGCGFDPRTGGKIPNFAVGYGAGGTAASLIKHDGNVYDESAYTSTASSPVAISAGMIFLWRDDVERFEGTRIDLITADFSPAGGHFDPNLYPTVGVVHDAAPTPDGHLLCFAEGFHQSFGLFPGVNPGSQRPSSLQWFVNRTYTTGLVGNDQKLVALANSVTADRSGKSNTLTQDGTVPAAAVASGAELTGYGPFSTSNYLSRASDADWDAVGTGSYSISLWFNASGSGSGTEWLAGFGNSGNSLRFCVFMQADGNLNCSETGATAAVETLPGGVNDDGVWHRIDFVRISSTERHVYLDGVLRSSSTTDAGSLTSSGNMLLRIGLGPDGSSFAAASTKVSLVRFTATALTATQVRRSYEAEAPMLAVNAKCLLQSGSTDAVLDAEVDPLSGKVIVTQTDSQEIFDGLAIETERTVATGGSTFEHGLIWGSAVGEINNANLFVSTPATDQRQVNEMVRSLSADLPAGIDMSKAKAWIYFENGASISASYNIEALTNHGTGNMSVDFAVPFKSAKYVAVSMAANRAGSSGGSIVCTTSDTKGQTSGNFGFGWSYFNDTYANEDGYLAFFGELENE